MTLWVEYAEIAEQRIAMACVHKQHERSLESLYEAQRMLAKAIDNLQSLAPEDNS